MARWKPRMVTKISMVLVITVIMSLMSKSAHHTSFLCFIYLNFQGDDEMTLWALFNKIMKCLLEARSLTFFWHIDILWHIDIHDFSSAKWQPALPWVTECFRVYLFALQRDLMRWVASFHSNFYRWGNWGIEMWKCFSLDSTAGKRQSLNREQVYRQCLARASL